MGTEHINYPLKTLKKAVNKPANTQEVTDGQNCRSLKRIAIGSLKTVQPDNFAQFISAVLTLRIMLGRPRLSCRRLCFCHLQVISLTFG